MTNSNSNPIPKQVKDITGNRYGRYLVLSYAGKTGRQPLWNCRCDCGNTKVVLGNSLKTGNTKSCGCLKVDGIIERSTKHGYAPAGQATSGYMVWQNMKRRCGDPGNRAYKNYGGRGIQVCSRWLDSFPNFIEDMGEPPKGYTLERIDNNGDYCPGNCKWIPRREQPRNTRRSHLLTVGGITKPIWAWAKEKGISWGTLSKRIYRGWQPDRAINTPVKESS